MSMAPTPTLVLDSVGKRYAERVVLTSAFFQAHPGRIHGIFGRNGAGKTTLLRIAVGLTAADHGTLRFRGEFYLRPRLPALARAGLFFWPASEPLLSPSITVRDHLRGFAQAWRVPDFDAVVARLGLESLLDQRGAALSGGEQQRCHLALALLRQPACVVADEPFRGLAPLDAELLMETFRKIADAGCAVVLSGHELTFLLGAVDEVTWVTSGTTRYLGPTAEAEAHETFRREFLGGWVRSA